jgi:hypothetical protein
MSQYGQVTNKVIITVGSDTSFFNPVALMSNYSLLIKIKVDFLSGLFLLFSFYIDDIITDYLELIVHVSERLQYRQLAEP